MLLRARALALSLKCRVELRRGNMIQIIAHRLESYPNQNLKHLFLFSIPGGDKVIHDLPTHVSTFSNDLFRQHDKCLHFRSDTGSLRLTAETTSADHT